MRGNIKYCKYCKLMIMELVDPYFIWYGQLLKKYKCSECGHEVVE